MSMRLVLFSAIVLSVAAAAGGCGDRAHLWESPLAVSGPHNVGDQVLWIDGTRGVVIGMRPNNGAPRFFSVSIPRNVTFAAPSPDKKKLLVLTGGKEAKYKGQQPEEPALTMIQPGGGGLQVVGSFTMPAPFNQLAVADDGSYAVAYFSESQTGDELLRNPNEVALLELSSPQSAANPTLRTVTSFGSAPEGVVFSPELSLGKSGAKRTLAVVVADNYLHFFDMQNRGRPAITVPLAKPGSDLSVEPQEVLFSAATKTVFVRASGADDLYAMSLLPKTPQGDGNDYTVMVNQPSAGKQVLDMILFSDGGKDTILTANASNDLALIDAATSQFSIVEVGEPVDRILAVPAEKPSMALIYSRGAPRIHFLELKDLAKNLEKNLISRSLAKPVRQLIETPDGVQALVIHDDQRTVISVLDLIGEHHTVSPIHGKVALRSFDFSAKTHLVGVSYDVANLGVLDLENLLTTNLRLDHKPTGVLAAGSDIVVTHEEPAGMVTVVPGPRSKREECRVVWGFLLSELLDRELRD